MSETQPVPLDLKCKPRKYFNPFSGYARSGEKERENNCTRALFVALRLIWKEGRLAEWMRLLETERTSRNDCLPTSPAIQQWRRIAAKLKNPNNPALRLLSAPKNAANAADFSERLVLVISGDPARHWECGVRKGERAHPDGCISADGGLILVESKALHEHVDALQIARHVQTLGRLTDPEKARLKEQGEAADSNSPEFARNRVEWSKNWRTDLETTGRVLAVAWRDIGKTLTPEKWKALRSPDTIEAVVDYYRAEGMLGYEGVSQLASFAQIAQSDFALWRETASRAQANDPDKDVSEVQKSDEDLPRNIRRSLELADDQMNEMANKVEQNLGSQWRRENDSNEAASAENQPDAGTSETNLCPIAPKRALRKGYDFTDHHLHWIGPLNRRICIGVDVLDDGLYITSHHWCSVPDFSGISPKDGADLDPQALHAKLTKKRQGALKSITDWCDKWIPLLERPPAAPWKLKASVTPYGFRGASPLWRNPQHYYKNTQQFQLDEVVKVFRTAREAAANNQPPFNCDPASSPFRFDCPELAELSGLDKAQLALQLNALRRLVRKPALSIKIRYGERERAWHDLGEAEAEDQFFKAIKVMAEWLAPAP